jgi:hypothetical protein
MLASSTMKDQPFRTIARSYPARRFKSSATRFLVEDRPIWMSDPAATDHEWTQRDLLS